MKTFRLFGSATLSILAILALILSGWQLAAGLSVCALLLLLLPSDKKVERCGDMIPKKRAKEDIDRIRKYRLKNPSASITDAVRAVEGHR